MKRHAFDPISLVLGVVLVAAALGGVFADELDPDIGRLIIPGAALMLGIGLLASALRVTITKDDG